MKLSLTEVQQREIARVLLQCSGNVSFPRSIVYAPSLFYIASFSSPFADVNRKRTTTHTMHWSQTDYAGTTILSKSRSNTACGTFFESVASPMLEAWSAHEMQKHLLRQKRCPYAGSSILQSFMLF